MMRSIMIAQKKAMMSHSSQLCRQSSPPSRTSSSARRRQSAGAAVLLRGCSLSSSRTLSSSTAAATTPTGEKIWNVYLSGEIHSDWRQVIVDGAGRQDHLSNQIVFTSPNTCHVDSDDCGAVILGMADQRPVWDMISARMNMIRNASLMREADIVIIKFGDKYRQWNAAYDAGYAAALQKPMIVIHPPEISHMLKEVNTSANVVCETPQQAIQTLAYVITGKLPPPKDGVDYIPIADRLGRGNPNP